MISLIYEDENFVAVSKPGGLLVHSDKRHAASTLVDWLLERYPEVRNVGDEPGTRPGIVHRLDKDTSGILIVARNREAFDYLKKLFQEHKVVKKYIALVNGKVEKPGVIDVPIGLKPGTVRRSVRAKNMKMVKEAVTEYRPFETFEKKGEFFTLLELTPRTGRTHQLRVHLASIHHPVVGDALYSPKGRASGFSPKENLLGLSRQFLHASSIEFTKPDGGRLRLEAELPAELRKIIDSLS